MKTLDEIVKKNIGYNQVFAYVDDILVNMFKYYMGLEVNVQDSPDGMKLLKCCATIVNLLDQGEVFQFKTKNNEVFNWNDYKKSENALTKDQMIKRLSKLQNRESKFNIQGCYVLEKMMQFCT